MTRLAVRRVTITVSAHTHALLVQLLRRGLHGTSVAGVVEGFTYAGLREAFEPPRLKMPRPRRRQ